MSNCSHGKKPFLSVCLGEYFQAKDKLFCGALEVKKRNPFEGSLPFKL
jgi:hypothetical protein